MPPPKGKREVAHPGRKPRIYKGSLVQMTDPWKHGPGKVMSIPDPGTACVKWPRRAKIYRHTIQYLTKVTSTGEPVGAIKRKKRKRK